jgi:hypothetical protein
MRFTGHAECAQLPAKRADATQQRRGVGRVRELRAVEQWLKLNINVLKSTIQTFEPQRAAVATVDAFSTFAQQSMLLPMSAYMTPENARGPAELAASCCAIPKTN